VTTAVPPDNSTFSGLMSRLHYAVIVRVFQSARDVAEYAHGFTSRGSLECMRYRSVSPSMKGIL